MPESLPLSITVGKTYGLGAPICMGLQKKGYQILLFVLLPAAIVASSVTVNTPTGEVTGSVVNYNNKRIHTFLGVPYAEPPVGNLRFRKTVPVKPWMAPVNANNLPPACHQYFPYNYLYMDNNPGQSEDCLYLNIWVPEFSNSSDKKAVMFWVHTGAFSYSSNRLPIYDGRVLAAKGDVIVVTINYRLGVLGFFTSDTEHAPGNAGLYDILEALKWVNENIAAFGGDNKRITVFGNSVGGITAGLLCVSPLSKGLFQRAIMQSGSPAYFLNDRRSENLELGQKLAENMECANENITLKANPNDVTECLRSKDPNDLVTVTYSLVPVLPEITFFTVTGDNFLPIDPLKAITEGNFNGVDTIIGNVADDGSLILVGFSREITGFSGELNPRINKTFGEFLIRQFFMAFPDPEAVVQHYLSGVEDDDFDAVRNQVYRSFGDFLFICPSKYFAEKVAEKNREVYRYYFSHRPSNTPWAEWLGVAHFEEVQFVFGRPLDSLSNYTREEEELSFEMVKQWTNFANGGKPSNTWQTFTGSDPYIEVFKVAQDNTSYFEAHEKNCEFFRPYFGF